MTPFGDVHTNNEHGWLTSLKIFRAVSSNPYGSHPAWILEESVVLRHPANKWTPIRQRSYTATSELCHMEWRRAPLSDEINISYPIYNLNRYQRTVAIDFINIRVICSVFLCLIIIAGINAGVVNDSGAFYIGRQSRPLETLRDCTDRSLKNEIYGDRRL